MPDYTLYYWPVPFRGQFVRAVLEHVHARWEEAGTAATDALLETAPADQPVPHMGPPVLTDHDRGVTLAQTPAILGYLGAKHGLLPGDLVRDGLTTKLVADANDVLDETTRQGGARMWTREAWEAYRPRLARWMAIFEATGRRHGLTAESGHILATEAPGIADLATFVLWGTMTAKLPALRGLFDASAPAVAGLCDRIAGRPEQAALRARSDAAYGEAWCGGEIEASLRAVL